MVVPIAMLISLMALVRWWNSKAPADQEKRQAPPAHAKPESPAHGLATDPKTGAQTREPRDVRQPESEDLGLAPHPPEALSLEAADREFHDRVSRIESQILDFLRATDGPGGLAYLQDLLASQKKDSGSPMRDERVARILAAKYLLWLADRNPNLADTIVTLTRTRLPTETDRFVRQQLILGLGGKIQVPFVVSGSSEGQSMKFTEGFFESRTASTERWADSLKKNAAQDALAVSALKEAALQSRDPARLAAIRVLAEMGTDVSRKAVLPILIADPSTRPLCIDSVLRNQDPETLKACVGMLTGEANPSVIGKIAAAIVKTSLGDLPEGTGQALLGTLQNLPEGNDLMAQGARAALIQASAAVFSQSSDPAALQAVVTGLRSESREAQNAALQAIAKNPKPEFTPVLRQELSKSSDRYTTECVGYALRKTDPTYQEPNLIWDVEALRERAKDPGTSQAERSAIQQELSAKEKALQELRKSR